ncbi:MAG: ribosomal-processing cysteine protease Prp [Clostridiales bacterium]|nr:ribosomal-processing cysteine protease Prp [Clostridiales bacterium]
MINITVLRDRRDKICGLKVVGHAEFDIEGQDIVCSAVSAIVQTAILGLTDVIGIRPHYSQDKGMIDLEISSELLQTKSNEISIVTETTLLGLKSIELGYSEYITIEERKVE